MNVLVLGGTGFVGRALIAELRTRGHEVMVVHRGRTEPEDLAPARHLHHARDDLLRGIEQIRSFSPAALVDVTAGTRSEAAQALAMVDAVDIRRLLVVSSGDVYRAYDAMRTNTVSDPLPLDESAPVRTIRFPYRDEEGARDYEKLDVEEAYLARGATVLRLPMVYGAHDVQAREDFVLRRVRSGRRAIPVGDASLLWTRGSVDQVALAIRLALELDVAGEILNVGEATTAPIDLWMRWIAAAAGSSIAFVRVPDTALPGDLSITRGRSQHLQYDVSKAAAVLGWRHADPEERVSASVRWHLAHVPGDAEDDFPEDDAALSLA
jgi:nucleoside-diphosphate-sugar epimerase